MLEPIYDPLVSCQVNLTTDGRIMLALKLHEDGQEEVEVIFPNAKVFAGVVTLMSDFSKHFKYAQMMGAENYEEIRAFIDGGDPHNVQEAIDKLEQGDFE